MERLKKEYVFQATKKIYTNRVIQRLTGVALIATAPFVYERFPSPQTVEAASCKTAIRSLLPNGVEIDVGVLDAKSRRSVAAAEDISHGEVFEFITESNAVINGIFEGRNFNNAPAFEGLVFNRANDKVLVRSKAPCGFGATIDFNRVPQALTPVPRDPIRPPVPSPSPRVPTPLPPRETPVPPVIPNPTVIISGPVPVVGVEEERPPVEITFDEWTWVGIGGIALAAALLAWAGGRGWGPSTVEERRVVSRTGPVIPVEKREVAVPKVPVGKRETEKGRARFGWIPFLKRRETRKKIEVKEAEKKAEEIEKENKALKEERDRLHNAKLDAEIRAKNVEGNLETLSKSYEELEKKVHEAEAKAGEAEEMKKETGVVKEEKEPEIKTIEQLRQALAETERKVEEAGRKVEKLEDEKKESDLAREEAIGRLEETRRSVEEMERKMGVVTEARVPKGKTKKEYKGEPASFEINKIITSIRMKLFGGPKEEKHKVGSKEHDKVEKMGEDIAKKGKKIAEIEEKEKWR